jgi:hypothetical protein
MMSHPFESLSKNQRKVLFWLALLGSLLLMTTLNIIGAPLITEAAPYGVVSFEFAGNAAQAQTIIRSWDQQARLYAAFSLGLDYLFMLAYSSAIGLGCLWAASVLRAKNKRLARLGAPLAWGQWAAVLLDAVENLALTRILLASAAEPWPELARWCATFKFLLVFLGLAYSLYGLVVVFVARWGSRR